MQRTLHLKVKKYIYWVLNDHRLVNSWYCIHLIIKFGKWHHTGPIPETVRDFWQMVWQENVFVIAMVTNLKEGDTVSNHLFKKCVLIRIPFFITVMINSNETVTLSWGKVVTFYMFHVYNGEDLSVISETSFVCDIYTVVLLK